VGKWGLAYNLYRMCSQSMGFKIESSIEADLNLWQERLYEVILTLPENDLSEEQVKKHFSEFEVKLIGYTEDKKITLGEEIISLSELDKLYNQSWAQNFETLT